MHIKIHVFMHMLMFYIGKDAYNIQMHAGVHAHAQCSMSDAES